MNKTDIYCDIIQDALSLVNANPRLVPVLDGDNSPYVIEGSSSAKVRSLLNNIIKNVENPFYLEIGMHLGSTFISALYNNKADAVGIDNYCESSDMIKKRMLANFDSFSKNLENCNTSFWFDDAFDVDPEKVCKIITGEDFRRVVEEGGEIDSVARKFNVYFYDGAHDHESQRKALTHYINVLDDTFIFIVDDWNDPRAFSGTQAGISELNLNVVKDWSLPASFNGDTSAWWNGVYVAVITK